MTASAASTDGTDALGPPARGHADLVEQLGLSVNTVKAHLHNVTHQVDARDRAQVITRAPAHGLL